MECRSGCGACCIALSISSSLPGMPEGKAAGIRCIHLSTDKKCTIHSSDSYPGVCKNLRPSEEMCGSNFDHALAYLRQLEFLTTPDKSVAYL